MSLTSDINKLKKLPGKVKDLFEKVEHIEKELKKPVEKITSLEKRFKWATKYVEMVRAKLPQLVEDVEGFGEKFEDIGGELKDVGEKLEKLPDTVKNEVEDCLEDALGQLAKAVAKEGLEKFRDATKAAKGFLDKAKESRPELVGAINQQSISLQLGPVTMDWDGFYDRVEDINEVIDKYINKPPKFSRNDIKKLVEDLGPTTIDFNLSINFALGVGSDELGVGFSIGSTPLVLFTEIGDLILDEMGVPE